MSAISDWYLGLGVEEEILMECILVLEVRGGARPSESATDSWSSLPSTSRWLILSICLLNILIIGPNSLLCCHHEHVAPPHA
jgi:hypothetical protein